MAQSLSGTPLDLQKLMTPPLFVPENLPALRLLELFKRSRPHLALVVDEYGGIQGLVTLNDLLESIVGDIPSSGQPPTPQAIQREDGSWLLDGMLPIDELKDWLKIGKLPGDDAGHFQTLGGFMMMQMGRIPSAAEYFEWGGFRFEVMDMDGKRVDKVLVVPL
jgi:putative hemolysin